MNEFSVKARWVVEFTVGSHWEPWLNFPINKPFKTRYSKAPRLTLEDAMKRAVTLRMAHPHLSFRLRHRTRGDIIMADIL